MYAMDSQTQLIQMTVHFLLTNVSADADGATGDKMRLMRRLLNACRTCTRFLMRIATCGAIPNALYKERINSLLDEIDGKEDTK